MAATLEIFHITDSFKLTSNLERASQIMSEKRFLSLITSMVTWRYDFENGSLYSCLGEVRFLRTVFQIVEAHFHYNSKTTWDITIKHYVHMLHMYAITCTKLICDDVIDDVMNLQNLTKFRMAIIQSIFELEHWSTVQSVGHISG